MSSPSVRRRSARVSNKRAKLQPLLSRLPLDIVDSICVFLWDKPKTLQAFALTCKPWHTAIQPHIFRRITATKANANMLEQLLQSIPTVAYWVKVVRIKGTPYDQRRDLPGGGVDPNETWMYGAFKVLFGQLQGVQHVQVSYIQPSSWNTQEVNVVLSQLAASNALRSFTFSECRLTRHLIHGFIRSLRHVPDLHFHNVQYQAPQVATPFPVEELRTPSKIERLCVFNNGGFSGWSEVQPVFESINLTGPHRYIRILHMHIDNRFALPEIAKFLPIVGPNLYHFQLYLYPYMGFTNSNEEEIEVLRAVDFSHFEKLRSIHLFDIEIAYLPQLFSRMRSPHLETLMFNLGFSWLSQMRPKDFVPLVSCLESTTAFDNLKETIIIYRGPVAVSRVQAKIDRLLPSFPNKRALSTPDPNRLCLTF